MGDGISVEAMKVSDLGAPERARWNALRQANPLLGSPYFDLRFMDVAGEIAPGAAVAVIRRGDEIEGYLPFQRRGALIQPMAAPMSDIHGLIAGYTGPGGKTVLPGRAEAKLEFRLVPAMTKEEAVAKLKAHLAKRGFDDVRVTVSGGYGPNETEEDALLIRAQKILFEKSGTPYSITPRNAGSWPGVIFNGPPLNLPASQFGLGRGGGAHAPNEWFLIDSSNPKVYGLEQATMAYVDYLYIVAEEAKKARK